MVEQKHICLTNHDYAIVNYKLIQKCKKYIYIACAVIISVTIKTVHSRHIG